MYEISEIIILWSESVSYDLFFFFNKIVPSQLCSHMEPIMKCLEKKTNATLE